MGSNANAVSREPWNKGKIVGQKAPFKLKDIWALRIHLQMENRMRELALFALGIDSKLRHESRHEPDSCQSGVWAMACPGSNGAAPQSAAAVITPIRVISLARRTSVLSQE